MSRSAPPDSPPRSLSPLPVTAPADSPATQAGPLTRWLLARRVQVDDELELAPPVVDGATEPVAHPVLRRRGQPPDDSSQRV